MNTENQQFCLRWHNFQNNLLSSLPQFLNDDDLTDVTLSAGGQHVRAHKLVLSASSLYFKEIFKELQPLQHPVIVLPGMNFKDLCALLTFIYSGEVNIYQDQLPGLLSMADTLHVRGLAEVQTSEKTAGDMTATKNDPPMKRARVNASPTHGVLQNSTNSEDNRFKCPTALPEPKNTVKDFNENSTNKFSGFEMFKNYFPYDDSTLRMMSSKSSKHAGSRIKQKQHGLGTTLPPGPYTPNMALNADLFHCLQFAKPIQRNSDDVVEAQDLRQNREVEMNETGMQETCSGSEMSSEPDPHPVSATLVGDIKTEVHSPESDDSCGGTIYDAYRDMGSTLRSLASAQSKGYATCPICKKQLSNQYNLRVHLETHQNVQYSCSVCSHVSRSRDALRKHVSYRHPVEGKEVNKKGKDSVKKSRPEDGIMEILEHHDSNPLSLASLSVVGP